MKRLIAAGCLMLGFAGTSVHAADEVSENDRPKNCREEVWRVYDSGHGPKSNWMGRARNRTVLVCDQAFVAQIQEENVRRSKVRVIGSR